MDGNELRKYLEGSAEDYQSLADHDRIYHKGGYKEGDACKVRETLRKSDDPDRMQKKAEGFAGRTQSRKDVAGVLEKLFGAGATFDENDSGDDNAVSFRVESKRILPFGEKQYERKLEDAGYKARLEFSGGFDPHQVRGSIRRFTPQENLERIKAQKPKYNPDGDYKVDGEYYDDHDEAMTAWKSAMKKYGSQAKRGVSSAGANDAAPAKRYLSMCQDEGTSDGAKKGWIKRKGGYSSMEIDAEYSDLADDIDAFADKYPFYPIRTKMKNKYGSSRMLDLEHGGGEASKHPKYDEAVSEMFGLLKRHGVGKMAPGSLYENESFGSLYRDHPYHSRYSRLKEGDKVFPGFE